MAVETKQYIDLGFPPVWLPIEGARLEGGAVIAGQGGSNNTPYLYAYSQYGVTAFGITSESATPNSEWFVFSGYVPNTHNQNIPMALDIYMSQYTNGAAPAIHSIEARVQWISPNDGLSHPGGDLAETVVNEGNNVITLNLLNSDPGKPIEAGAKLTIGIRINITSGATGTVDLSCGGVVLREITV